MRSVRRLVVLSAIALLTLFGVTMTSASAAVNVLRVGSFNGIPGQFASIQAAVNAAQPGDWILIGPGDYHENADESGAQLSSDAPAAVLDNVTNTHIRGMNRNTVVLDGTLPGSPRCSSSPANQDFGPLDSSGQHRGRNGIETNASGVSYENFTACNFLAGSTDSGNEIWWNGGDDGGHIGLHAYSGNYISATSTFYNGPATAATYGIFVSNSDGPGVIDHSYASNFSDSGYYIGACPDCNAVLNHPHSENNALGYSGTNSGGHLIIENGEWDHNKTGLVSNSQNSADPPSPQNGQCPNNGFGPTGTHSCWVFINNNVHDNNNPNVPAIGDAAIGPVGTGLVLAGDRNNTVTGNLFANNGAWGVLTTLFPDTGSGNPNNVSNCHGGVPNTSLFGTSIPCLFDDWGNAVINNKFSNNGFYGNVTNGDIADFTIPPIESLGAPGNCFHGNKKLLLGTPASTWPILLQTTQSSCNNPLGYPDPASTAVLGVQVACATQAFFSCPPLPLLNYPRQTHVVMPPMPAQTTMPNPCAGVPTNPWCPSPFAPLAAGGSRVDRPGARVPDAVRPGLD